MAYRHYPAMGTVACNHWDTVTHLRCWHIGRTYSYLQYFRQRVAVSTLFIGAVQSLTTVPTELTFDVHHFVGPLAPYAIGSDVRDAFSSGSGILPC